MRKPVYKKCVLFPAMFCNPECCAHYAECKLDKVYRMSEIIREIFSQGTNEFIL